jgi:hypothetical protein
MNSTAQADVSLRKERGRNNSDSLFLRRAKGTKRDKIDNSVTLVDLQLDAQNSYLFTYNTFIKILYMFRALPCSTSGGLRRNCVYAASGIVTLCR